MRVLADENFPVDAVEALRECGHDVVWIRTAAPGSPDLAVISWAARERRTLLTFDKDFGELAYRVRRPAPAGIILFRVPPRSALYVARLAVATLERDLVWQGHFSVVEETRIRQTLLPSPGDQR